MKTELGQRIAGPEVEPAEIEALCDFLRGRCWLKAVEIEAATGMDDRKIRAVAEHSDGRIIGGQKGYHLLARTTSIEDVDIAATRLESQGKRMIARARRIRWRFHHYAREPEAPTEKQAELITQ